MSVDLSVKVAGLTFASPLLNASGCFNAAMFDRVASLNGLLGAVVTKTVTPTPRKGNPQQRTVELPGVGMLNSIGLQNPGMDVFLEEEAVSLQAYGLPVVLSVSAGDVPEFLGMLDKLEAHPNGKVVRAVELNLSCPNVAKGGVDFGRSPETVESVTRAVAERFDGPVFAKLTPNVTDIVSLAEAAVRGGASGITAINTVIGCSIDIKQKRPYLPRVSGGYSGPGIKPIALHAVWNIHKSMPDVPIIAVGGISSANDVLEFLMAGASLVELGTACFREPTVFATVHRELRQFMQDEGLSSLAGLTGCAHDEKILLQ